MIIKPLFEFQKSPMNNQLSSRSEVPPTNTSLKPIPGSEFLRMELLYPYSHPHPHPHPPYLWLINTEQVQTQAQIRSPRISACGQSVNWRQTILDNIGTRPKEGLKRRAGQPRCKRIGKWKSQGSRRFTPRYACSWGEDSRRVFSGDDEML